MGLLGSQGGGSFAYGMCSGLEGVIVDPGGDEAVGALELIGAFLADMVTLVPSSMRSRAC